MSKPLPKEYIKKVDMKEIVGAIEMYDQGLADTLAIAVDPELQDFFKESEKDVNNGSLIPLNET